MTHIVMSKTNDQPHVIVTQWVPCPSYHPLGHCQMKQKVLQ